MQEFKKNSQKNAYNNITFLEETVNQQFPSKIELFSLIKKFAPILFFHPETECMPVSVEWYFERSWLVNKASKVRVEAKEEHLIEDKVIEDLFYLDPKEGVSLSHRNQSVPIKTYVNAKAHTKDFLDLQYWFFFPQTKSASATVKWMIDGIKGHEGRINLNPLGNNNGIWERITVRINLNTNKAEQFFFPLFGNGLWVSASKVRLQNNQVCVFSSKNGAEFYPEPGFNTTEKLRFNLFSSQLEFCLENETQQGDSLNFKNSCELISTNYLEETIHQESSWLNFKGNWGNPQPNHLTVPAIKRIVFTTFGKTLEFLLSRDILEELVNYLLNYFSEQSYLKSLGPKSRKCWTGEEEH